MEIKKGTSRICIIIGNYAIKIPTIRNHRNFLYGCYCNYSERNTTKVFKVTPKFYEKFCPCIFCSWFGLIALYPKCEALNRNITEQEHIDLELFHGGDDHKDNFGYLKGKLVCLDYP